MFEDLVDIHTNATITVNDKKYIMKVYAVNMAAGTVTGFIQDDTRKIDGYTDYEISIPITGTNCEWAFPIMVVRISPDTLKFYTPECK